MKTEFIVPRIIMTTKKNANEGNNQGIIAIIILWPSIKTLIMHELA